jgi:hypothetical protein
MSDIQQENGYLVQDLKASRKDALVKEIKSLVLDPRIRKLPVDRLAQKYECSRAEIFSAKNKLILSLPQQNVDFVKRKFALQFEKLEQIVEDLIEQSEDNEDLRKNVELALKVMKENTDYLERFHLKRKATENINIDGEVKVTSIQVKIIDSESPKAQNGTFIEKE